MPLAGNEFHMSLHLLSLVLQVAGITAVAWRKTDEILSLRTKWMHLIGERYDTGQGKEAVEYWRVIKPDSVIVIVLHEGHIILPAPSYRPGIGKPTVDFVGGRRRSCNGTSVRDDALALIKKELNVTAADARTLRVVNEGPRGYAIDSSFSSHRLWVAVCRLKEGVVLPSDCVRYRVSEVDVLLRDLECLQCRAALMELMLREPGLFKERRGWGGWMGRTAMTRHS
ncbi:unnamed protein product [Vitrella brassicaformis CCMP3155]|uniref:Nudix hydrolase domain-containing protein n=1 Tax=Vitrella brassicaformis (strain CCMP3155) TaxID=1169540 RepID=A0A0G4EY23_VITBC|nr:unnamed protein product [Vitrella brassicaformis CCMP3155]|eukprot:CEM03325.1 unnamed protein product [Vitrella brassicaformis CCMP3155]